MNIINIVRSLQLGITKPYLVECNDGKKYVAKFPGNPDGTKVLINEYVCASLAKILGLPIPNFELVKVDNIKIFENSLMDIELKNGTVFCSEWMDKTSPVPGYLILSKTENKFDAIKILIFDVIIGNNDRNPGNLLINFKNNSLVAIDHSHVFVHQALWNDRTLNELIKNKIDISSMNKFNFNNLSMCLNEKGYKKTIDDYIKRIKNIKEEDVNLIINSIPHDWIISEKEKIALKNFLLNRMNRIDEICKILNIEGGD